MVLRLHEDPSNLQRWARSEAGAPDEEIAPVEVDAPAGGDAAIVGDEDVLLRVGRAVVVEVVHRSRRRPAAVVAVGPDQQVGVSEVEAEAEVVLIGGGVSDQLLGLGPGAAGVLEAIDCAAIVSRAILELGADGGVVTAESDASRSELIFCLAVACVDRLSLDPRGPIEVEVVHRALARVVVRFRRRRDEQIVSAEGHLSPEAIAGYAVGGDDLGRLLPCAAGDPLEHVGRSPETAAGGADDHAASVSVEGGAEQLIAFSVAGEDLLQVFVGALRFPRAREGGQSGGGQCQDCESMTNAHARLPFVGSVVAW